MKIIVGILIALIVAIWVYSDAKKRGKSSDSARGWFLGTFLLLIIFLPIWLIARPKFPSELSTISIPQLCVHCGKYYEGNPFYCPNCGHELEEAPKEVEIDFDTPGWRKYFEGESPEQIEEIKRMMSSQPKITGQRKKFDTPKWKKYFEGRSPEEIEEIKKAWGEKEKKMSEGHVYQKEELGAMKILGYLVLIAVILAIVVGGGFILWNSLSPSSNPEAGFKMPSIGKQLVTFDEYKGIQNGMSYKEVVAIIGAEGEEMSRNKIDGVPGIMESIETVMYQWVNSNGSNMNAIFQNDKLVQKAQFGLK